MDRYASHFSAHETQRDGCSLLHKGINAHKTCQEGMPRDLISAHEELCDTEVPQTQKTSQRCGNTTPQRQESVCDPEVMRIPGTTDNLHLQSKAWNRPKVSNALQQRETYMISPALSSPPSFPHTTTVQAGTSFTETRLGSKQDFVSFVIQVAYLLSCSCFHIKKQIKKRSDQTSGFSLTDGIQEGSHILQESSKLCGRQLSQEKYSSILGTKYPLNDDPR